ncbi:MAG TPA: ABC transporter ATP-binding protein [Polyangiaceae bacterium]|nr:ABC transporter ATP-binding protein [Polyangiaceae bacterium]
MSAPLLSVRELSLGYPGRDVLERVTFDLYPGELVGVIGANGCGKSTLLYAVLGSIHPRAGEVQLSGRSLGRMPARERARVLTLVLQDTHSGFPMRVWDLVALGRTPHLPRFGALRERDATVVRSALVATDTERFAERRVGELSGGERQRVHLARAIAQEPSILLLDEPTASLDVSHQLEALEFVRGFVGAERAALVALHDLSLAARFCDRLLVLAAGRVCADGPPERVLDAALLGAVFGVRAEVCRSAGGAVHVHILESVRSARVRRDPHEGTA